MGQRSKMRFSKISQCNSVAFQNDRMRFHILIVHGISYNFCIDDLEIKGQGHASNGDFHEIRMILAEDLLVLLLDCIVVLKLNNRARCRS